MGSEMCIRDSVTIDGGTTKLIIAASTIDGDLTIRTGNAADTSGIIDSGTVTVGGNLSVTNDVDNGDIDMGTLAVTGSITLTRKNRAVTPRWLMHRLSI